MTSSHSHSLTRCQSDEKIIHTSFIQMDIKDFSKFSFNQVTKKRRHSLSLMERLPTCKCSLDYAIRLLLSSAESGKMPLHCEGRHSSQTPSVRKRYRGRQGENRSYRKVVASNLSEISKKFYGSCRFVSQVYKRLLKNLQTLYWSAHERH